MVGAEGSSSIAGILGGFVPSSRGRDSGVQG
jgi:hypothetical protein